MNLRLLRCSIISFLILSSVTSAEEPPQTDGALRLKVAAVYVKDGMKAEFVAEGTPAFLVGPLDVADPGIRLLTVNKIGQVSDIEVLPGKEYRLIVDTTKAQNNSLAGIYLPAVLSLRAGLTAPENAKVNPVVGDRVVAEARSLYDFKSIDRVAEQIRQIENAFPNADGGELAQQLAAARKRIAELSKLSMSAFVPQRRNNVSQWKDLRLDSAKDMRANTIEVSGIAAVRVQGENGEEWSPYQHCQIFACAADGSDLSIPVNKKSVFTEADGSFTITLPKSVCVRLVVDAQYHERTRELLKLPAYVDVCPLKISGSNWDTSISINNCDTHPHDLANATPLITKLLTDVAANATSTREKEQVQHSLNRYRSTQAASSKWNVVACLDGTAPDDQWDQVLQAANKYDDTCFWVLAMPGETGVAPDWDVRFDKYIPSQFREIGVDVPQASLPKTNFRIVGYVSAWGPKSKTQIDKEIDEWIGSKDEFLDGQMRATGVFLDNMWRLPVETRKELYRDIKKKYGEDFAIFGACGEPVNKDSTEVSAAANVDVLFMGKSTELDFPNLATRQVEILAGRPAARFCAISLGVDDKAMPSILARHVKAAQHFIGISDFLPETNEDRWYSSEVPLPLYWTDLCKLVDAKNKSDRE